MTNKTAIGEIEGGYHAIGALVKQSKHYREPVNADLVLEICNKALARIPELREREWQDISTAPRDGTVFIAAIPDFSEPMAVAMKTLVQTVGDQDIEYRGFCIDTYSVSKFDSYDEVHPTHWMPLPAAPKTQGGGE